MIRHAIADQNHWSEPRASGNALREFVRLSSLARDRSVPALDAMPGLTKNDWKGLWAILWRVLIFGPILWVLGFALLLLVIAAFVAPPIYAAVAFFTGDWLFGIAALTAWFIVLRIRRPIFRWTLDGIEYGSI